MLTKSRSLFIAFIKDFKPFFAAVNARQTISHESERRALNSVLVHVSLDIVIECNIFNGGDKVVI